MMEQKFPHWDRPLFLLAILLVGLSFRLVGLGWGEGQPIHPDEEFLRQVTAAVSLPDRLSVYLDTARSPLNPYNRGYGFFVYGTLPLFLTRAVGEALDRGCRDGAAVSLPARLLAPVLLGSSSACWPGSFSGSGARHLGRLLAALLDTGGILFVFLAGRRLRSDGLGLLAAALYALAVLPIQQSHFYTVDAFANFFVAATLYLALCLAVCSQARSEAASPACSQARSEAECRSHPQARSEAECRPHPQARSEAASPACSQARSEAECRSHPQARSEAECRSHPQARSEAECRSHPQARSEAASPACSQARSGAEFRYSCLYALLAGLTTGLGMACKISVWPLGILVGLAAMIRAFHLARMRSASGAEHRPTFHFLFLTACFLLPALLAAFLAFRLAQPYAFMGPGFFGLRLNPQWLRNMAEVRGLMSGAVDTYPGHQWTNRLPLVFPWINMVFWGLGLPLGLTAWAGWGWGGADLLRRAFVVRHEAPRAEAQRSAVLGEPFLLPWLWATGYFLYQGTQWVKSIRYLLPVYPAFVLLAAWLLVRLWVWNSVGRYANRRFLRSVIRPLLPATLLLATFLWALAFTSVYRRPHTRIAASRWIFQNIPVGSVLATEHWDWPPPLRVDGKDPFGGMYRGLSTSSDGTLQLYHDDTPQKRADLLNWLDEADYIIIGSNRLYASIVRLPTRYPLTIAYYRALFSGELGFELVADFTSYPALGPFQFPDTEEPFPIPEAPYQYRAAPLSVPMPPAEEAFSVYDHPRVLIFRKTAAYSRARAEALLPVSLLDNVVWVTPKQETLRTWRRILPWFVVGHEAQRSAAPFVVGHEAQRSAAPILDPQTWAQQQAGGTWSAMFDRGSLLNRSSFLAAVVWYLTAGMLGWLAFPILWRTLPSLTDRGYGIARAVGLLVVSYLTWLAASLRILPNTRSTIALGVFLLTVSGGLVAWRHRSELRDFLRQSWALLLVHEGLFLALYAFWAWVRAQNPDLWHPVVGGEKPMDFAYLNAVIKSTWFPPYNPWFAGGYINYYYFGFVLVGTLSKLTGIMPSIAYNLALALFYALAGGAAFSVAFSLVARSVPPRSAPARSAPRSDSGVACSQPRSDSGVACSQPRSDGGVACSQPHSDGGVACSQPRSDSGVAPGSPYIAGFLAVLFLLVLGNLGEARLLYDSFQLVAGDVPFRSTIPGLEALVRALKGFGMALGGAPLPFRPETPYWYPTRMIPPDASGVGPITEFPAFTFLYADLHAHLLALPYTLCALAVMVEWVLGVQRTHPGAGAQARGPSLLLAALVIGALRATNTWDYPTYLLLAMAVLAWSTVRSKVVRSKVRSAAKYRLWIAVLSPLLLAGLTVGLFLPYIRAYIAPYNRMRLWTDARTPLDIYLLLLGQFLFPLGTWLVVHAWRVLACRELRSAVMGQVGSEPQGEAEWRVSSQPRSEAEWRVSSQPRSEAEWRPQGEAEWRIRWPLFLFGLGGLMLCGLVVAGLGVPVAAVALPMGILAFVLAFWLPAPRALASFWVAVALALTLGVEVLVLEGDIGRMNTVFKFHFQAWTMLSVSAAVALVELAETTDRWPRDIRRLWWGAMEAIVFAMVLFPAMSIPAKVRDRFTHATGPTLDGMAYIQYSRTGDVRGEVDLGPDYWGILWLLDHVHGSPVILEGLGEREYLWQNRISIYTGLPAVVGWRWHEVQQGMGEGVAYRYQEVRECYTTPDPERALAILRRYNVRYVYVGPYERLYYNPAGLNKFSALVARGILRLVYDRAGVQIYEVRDG